MVKKLILLSFLVCSLGFANETKTNSQIAMEAYNFLRGLESKELGYTQNQLYKQGINRLKELVRKLNFVAFHGEEEFSFSRGAKCNEYHLMRLKDEAKENALTACKQNLLDGFECVPYQATIDVNTIGRCHAKATAHRVKSL